MQVLDHGWGIPNGEATSPMRKPIDPEMPSPLDFHRLDFAKDMIRRKTDLLPSSTRREIGMKKKRVNHIRLHRTDQPTEAPHDPNIPSAAGATIVNLYALGSDQFRNRPGLGERNDHRLEPALLHGADQPHKVQRHPPALQIGNDVKNSHA